MAVSTGFRLPLGNGFSTDANDGDGFYVDTNFDQYNPEFNAYHLGDDWNAEGAMLADLGMPVYAISNGTVVERGVLASFGNYLIIRHDLPAPITIHGITTSSVYSLYGHLQNPATVGVGAVVGIGQQIGNAGYTGMADGNSHVHIEIRLGNGAGYTNTDGYSPNGAPAGWVDPTDFINAYRSLTGAPLLASASPADDTAAVPVASNIVLTFNEAVTAGSGNIVIYNRDGSVARTIAVTDASQVSFSGNTVTINPASDLAANSGYYVNVAAGAIRDLGGDSYTGLTGSTALNFATGGPDLAGNTLAAARAVTLGATPSHYGDFVGPSDTNDYYKFTTSGATSFALSLTGLTADADVYLLNAAGTEVAHSYRFGAAPEAINIASLAGGTYYVRVRAYNSDATDYELSLSATPPAAPPPDLAGNTLAAARAVTLGSATTSYGDFVGPADTNDYYKFTTAGATSFALSLTGMTADADVSLLNASGTEVAHSNNSGSTPEAINIASLAAGTYYVQVHPYLSAATNYTLGLSAAPPPADLAGNTLATARAVTVGSTATSYGDYVGPIDSNDYYKFTTAGATHFVLHLTGMTADADVSLLNAAGVEIAHSDNSGAASEAIDIANLAAGTYYVQVHPYNGAATDYMLDLTGMLL